MNNITLELKKMDAYNGIEYAQRIVELFNEFPDDSKQIDDYVEKRVYAVAASADNAISKVQRNFPLREFTKKEILQFA